MHWDLVYTPAVDDAPDAVTVTYTRRSDDAPVAGLNVVMAIYPGWEEPIWDEIEEGESIGALIDLAGVTDAAGQLTLTWTDELDAFTTLEAWSDLYGDADYSEWLSFAGLDFTAGQAASNSSIRLSDVTGHTHENAIYRIAQSGVSSGYPDATFRPNNNVTRGQMATFISRAWDVLWNEG